MIDNIFLKIIEKKIPRKSFTKTIGAWRSAILIRRRLCTC